MFDDCLTLTIMVIRSNWNFAKLAIFLYAFPYRDTLFARFERNIAKLNESVHPFRDSPSCTPTRLPTDPESSGRSHESQYRLLESEGERKGLKRAYRR